MQAKDILGLDVGLAHTGVARASNVALLSEPLDSFATKGVIDQLKRLVEKTPTEAIVVGLPRNLEGNDTRQTEWVREWVTQAKKEISVPFYWQDEALTSHQAAKISYKNSDEHAKAAAIILQDFLDTPDDERVAC
jgi:putative Holliday junction resolvase